MGSWKWIKGFIVERSAYEAAYAAVSLHTEHREVRKDVAIGAAGVAVGQQMTNTGEELKALVNNDLAPGVLGGDIYHGLGEREQQFITQDGVDAAVKAALEVLLK